MSYACANMVAVKIEIKLFAPAFHPGEVRLGGEGRENRDRNADRSAEQRFATSERGQGGFQTAGFFFNCRSFFQLPVGGRR